IDPTPRDDREFPLFAGGREYRVTSGPAAGHVDLLTVVEHELGHLLGLPDLDARAHPHELMAESLGVGTRRLPPTRQALDTIFAALKPSAPLGNASARAGVAPKLVQSPSRATVAARG